MTLCHILPEWRGWVNMVTVYCSKCASSVDWPFAAEDITGPEGDRWLQVATILHKPLCYDEDYRLLLSSPLSGTRPKILNIQYRFYSLNLFWSPNLAIKDCLNWRADVNIQRFGKIIETPWNFKQIYFNMVFWLQPCGEIRLSYSFLGNCIFEMAIKLCCNFGGCILVILPNNSRECPTVPIRQLLLSFRVLLQWWGFSFFLKCG